MFKNKLFNTVSMVALTVASAASILFSNNTAKAAEVFEPVEPVGNDAELVEADAQGFTTAEPTFDFTIEAPAAAPAIEQTLEATLPPAPAPVVANNVAEPTLTDVYSSYDEVLAEAAPTTPPKYSKEQYDRIAGSTVQGLHPTWAEDEHGATLVVNPVFTDANGGTMVVQSPLTATRDGNARTLHQFRQASLAGIVDDNAPGGIVDSDIEELRDMYNTMRQQADDAQSFRTDVLTQRVREQDAARQARLEKLQRLYDVANAMQDR